MYRLWGVALLVGLIALSVEANTEGHRELKYCSVTLAHLVGKVSLPLLTLKPNKKRYLTGVLFETESSEKSEDATSIAAKNSQNIRPKKVLGVTDYLSGHNGLYVITDQEEVHLPIKNHLWAGEILIENSTNAEALGQIVIANETCGTLDDWNLTSVNKVRNLESTLRRHLPYLISPNFTGLVYDANKTRHLEPYLDALSIAGNLRHKVLNAVQSILSMSLRRMKVVEPLLDKEAAQRDALLVDWLVNSLASSGGIRSDTSEFRSLLARLNRGEVLGLSEWQRIYDFFRTKGLLESIRHIDRHFIVLEGEADQGSAGPAPSGE